MTKVELLDQIDNLLKSKNNISEWEVSFLESIKSQAIRYTSMPDDKLLTLKQQKLLERISEVSKLIPLNQEKWYQGYNDEKKRIFKACIGYYKSLHSGYFSRIINKFDQDNDHIPNEFDYNKICSNKYTKSIVESVKNGPLFNIGEIVQGRANISHVGQTGVKYVGSYTDRYIKPSDLLMITKVTENYKSHAKGSRIYIVLPVGKSKPFEVEERTLKSFKNKKK